MIDFACKQFSLDDVIKCGLGLTKADFNVAKYLIKNSIEWFTSDKIAKNLNLNQTTVQRALKKLFDKNVVIRSQKNLENGGYIYVYQIKSKKEIHSLIMGIIDKWTKKIELELEQWQNKKN